MKFNLKNAEAKEHILNENKTGEHSGLSNGT